MISADTSDATCLHASLDWAWENVAEERGGGTNVTHLTFSVLKLVLQVSLLWFIIVLQHVSCHPSPPPLRTLCHPSHRPFLTSLALSTSCHTTWLHPPPSPSQYSTKFFPAIFRSLNRIALFYFKVCTRSHIKPRKLKIISLCSRSQVVSPFQPLSLA